MQQRDRDRVAHMLDAAHKAVAYAEHRTRSELEMDELLRLGLTKLVEIVGEAAKQVSENTRQEYPRSVVQRRPNAGPAGSPLLRHRVDILWQTAPR